MQVKQKYINFINSKKYQDYPNITQNYMSQLFKKSLQASNSQYSQSGTGRSSQIRYKKALKQISKLVLMNGTLKKQLQIWQQNYDKLKNQYDIVYSKCKELSDILKGNNKNNETHNISAMMNIGSMNVIIDQEQKNIQQNMNKSIQHINTTQQIFKSLERSLVQSSAQKIQQPLLSPILTQISITSHNNPISLTVTPNKIIKQQQLNKQLSQYAEQNKYLRQQFHKLQVRLIQKQDIIHQLQLVQKNNHQRITQLQQRCGNLNEQLFKIKQQQKQRQKLRSKQEELQKQREKQRNISLQVSQQLMKQRKRSEQLQARLRKTQAWTLQLQAQYQKFRKQSFISQQPTKTIQQTPKKVYLSSSIQPSLYAYIDKSPSNNNKRKYQSQIEILRKQYTNKKIKYKQQIIKLKQQKQQMSKKIVLIMNLMYKQQNFIENQLQSRNYQNNHDINQ